MISLIVARNGNNGIGFNNELPWGYIPEDMKWFVQNTKHKHVLMGSNTFKSIGKPLPNRINIIASRTMESTDEFIVTNDAYEYARSFNIAHPDEELVIMGGETIYRELFPLIEKIYLTEIKSEAPCDAYFNYDLSNWNIEYMGYGNNDGDTAKESQCKFLILNRIGHIAIG